MKKITLLIFVVMTIVTPSVFAKSMYKQFKDLKEDVVFLKEEVEALKESNHALEKELISEQKQRKDLTQQLHEQQDSEEESLEIVGLEEVREDISQLNRNTSGNHIKFGVDFRTSVDNIQYKMADGSDKGNDALFGNRLWLNMNWKANQNISFTGQLAYNKAFGARGGVNSRAFEEFDWIASENPYDATLRVRSAYFLYVNNTFMGTDIPWAFSIGRRPSTNGKLISLREDDKSASPLAHSINVEFDGLSTKFGLSNLTNIEGMYIRLCAGRGLTNANARFSPTPYATDANDTQNIDLAGFIFVPYNNGQYALYTQFYMAQNLIDVVDVNDFSKGFKTVGDLYSATASFTLDGVGDGWSDLTDYMLFFMSASLSHTYSHKGEKMLGSEESQNGYSLWTGVQFDSLVTDEGRWGVEYNYGSKYWRAMTYAEDTMAGSKIAVRGSAYEMYVTEPLVDESFSMQLRFTYMDYAYTGSNGFFGEQTGAPVSIEDAKALGFGSQVVDTASDIRLYLRYKY